MTDSYLAPHDDGKIVILEQVANGGWIVRQPSKSHGVMDEILGAFTRSEDMLDALTSALTGETQ